MSDADIATLGIAIDTTQVTQSTAALNALGVAAASAADKTSMSFRDQRLVLRGLASDAFARLTPMGMKS